MTRKELAIAYLKAARNCKTFAERVTLAAAYIANGG